MRTFKTFCTQPNADIELQNPESEINKLLDFMGNTEFGISTFLMENLKLNLPVHQHKEVCLNEMQQYKDSVELIEKLGWLEHTSDWDLYHIIEFHDGTLTYSMNGYTDLEIDQANYTITITIDNDPDCPM